MAKKPENSSLLNGARGRIAKVGLAMREAARDIAAGVEDIAPSKKSTKQTAVKKNPKSPIAKPKAKKAAATNTSRPAAQKQTSISARGFSGKKVSPLSARTKNNNSKTAGKKKKAPPPKKTKTPIPKLGLASRIFRGAMLAFSVGAVAGIGGLWVAFMEIAPKQTATDLWAVNRLPAVIVLDKDGNELGSRGARYGEAITVEELPPYLVNAFLSTEDRRFYDHQGVDLRGMARAFMRNAQSGSVVEGGSTITQQLAKNLFLSPEQTYIRKAREAMLAIWIEGRFSKNEILSLYLNRIYLGAGAYGIESAAQTYFSKSAQDVTLSEAVLLAGLPKAPSTLAPTQNPFGAQDRAEEVLDNLLEIKAITPFEARDAKANPAVIKPAEKDAELGYIFDYATALAKEMVGDYSGDLIIRTTIDRRMQEVAEQSVKSAITVDTKLAGAEQAALVAYDTSGALRALVGGRSYIESQFNRATQAKRQPGSAFKPFVYTAAFETNEVVPSTKFTDKPIKIDDWEPRNYSDSYLGEMRLTEAMSKSVNSIAVQVSEFAGRGRVADMAKRLGIKTDLPAVPSIALGGANVTLEELTAAYIPFSTQGLRVETYVIDSISDGAGTTLYTHEKKPTPRVLRTQITKDISHLLYQVVTTGTGRGANIGRRHAVGKTGTTNDWRDAWFVGYSAQIISGVWVGNDQFRPMDKVTGGGIPADIWKTFMTSAHGDLPRVRIPGAFPAATFTDEDKLIGFYDDVSRDLRRVGRDGGRRLLRRR